MEINLSRQISLRIFILITPFSVFLRAFQSFPEGVTQTSSPYIMPFLRKESLKTLFVLLFLPVKLYSCLCFAGRRIIMITMKKVVIYCNKTP